ncbi:hypothetical protein HanHA89_Chr04g0167451 [Helianthus annuus]|nr:hypothetical protein HanHA89_Chr04g0167451 [Helianthus annuus]
MYYSFTCFIDYWVKEEKIFKRRFSQACVVYIRPGDWSTHGDHMRWGLRFRRWQTSNVHYYMRCASHKDWDGCVSFVLCSRLYFSSFFPLIVFVFLLFLKYHFLFRKKRTQTVRVYYCLGMRSHR